MTERRTRLQIEQLIIDSQPWPLILTDALNAQDREKYLNHEMAISMYVGGEPISEIISRTRMTAGGLHKLINRSLSLAPDGQVWGSRALLPNVRLKEYVRTASTNSGNDLQSHGFAGVLNQIFNRFPEIKIKLIKTILKLAGEDVYEFKVKPKTVHKMFIDLLRKENLTSAEWPFNTKYMGSRAINTFFNAVIDQNFDRAVTVRGSDDARAKLSVGTGNEVLLKLDRLFDAVEVDSHKIDAHFSVGIRNPDGLFSYVTTKRINLLALVERASKAVLWYLVVYNAEVNAQDVVRLITESLRAELPKPSSNLLEINMTGDAGFPAEKIPELKHALPSVLLPDNALSNLAAAVSQKLRKELGFSICYGAPGHFENRPNIERTFKNIADGIFQRSPSTTGTRGVGREKNGEEIARELRIDANIVEELSYHHFAQHNALPSEGIFNLTPLEYMRQTLALDDGHFIPRALLSHRVGRMAYYKTTLTLMVRCYPDKGVRPFVNIDRVKYSNDILRGAVWLKNKTITVEVDEQDMRAVHAYFPDGTFLGVLKASGKWSRTKHSRKTRKQINALKARRLLTVIENDDPVLKFLDYLNGVATGSSKSTDRNHNKSTAASNFKRVEKDSLSDDPDSSNDDALSDTLILDAKPIAGSTKLLNPSKPVMPGVPPNLIKLLRGL